MDRKDIKIIFGKNLRRLRIERGMSQDELAKAIGYNNRASINKIEMGHNIIPTDKIQLTADVLGVSPLDLFRDSDSDSDEVVIVESQPDFFIRFNSLSEEDKESVIKYIDFLKYKQKGDVEDANT